MSAPLLVAFACFLAETWMFYRVLGQRKKLAGRLNQVSADLTDAEQALNVLIHERAAYKDENARLRKAIVGTREGLKMMAEDSGTEESRAEAFSDAQLFLDEHCRQCGFPEGVEVES